MNKANRKIYAVMLILAIILSRTAIISVSAASKTALDTAVNKAAAYIYKTVSAPAVNSVGGEWAVIGLARSGYGVPDSYYENYYKTVEKYVKDKKGILHDVKYTEYSRVILGLTAAGYDPRNVAGYDLTLPLGDFNRTIWQGINGPVFALIALDAMNYPVPKNSEAKTQATRDLYVEEILRRQTPDGGWNLTAGSGGEVGKNEKADPDMTGMVLQALAKYQDKPEVKTAVDKALECLSSLQDKNGGYTSRGNVNAESAVQVLVALCGLGIPADDSRFVKNGKTLVDNILSFQNSDGSFKHTGDSAGNNQMSTEQALYGLVAAQRAINGKNSLYRMDDTVKRVDFLPVEIAGNGLPNKHKDVKPVAAAGKKTFTDIKNHANQAAIEALAERGIINGKTDTAFDPDAAVTRAEFAAAVTRALGLPAKRVSIFTDVSPNTWYAEYIGAAYYYGIVTGTSATTFNPRGMITRQEAAVMTARAAKLCGMDTTAGNAEIRDILAQFGDYVKSSDWARVSLAFCYRENILPQSDLDIRPFESIKRCEVAEMLYRMLKAANLL